MIEKKKKKRNIVIKRVWIKEKGKRETGEKIMRAVRVEVEIKEMKRIEREIEKKARRWYG